MHAIHRARRKERVGRRKILAQRVDESPGWVGGLLNPLGSVVYEGRLCDPEARILLELPLAAENNEIMRHGDIAGG